MLIRHLLYPSELSSLVAIGRPRTGSGFPRRSSLDCALRFGGTRPRRAHRAGRDLTSPDPGPSEGTRLMHETTVLRKRISQRPAQICLQDVARPKHLAEGPDD